MYKTHAIALSLLVVAPLAFADERPLICFGNEPSWGVDLTSPGVARVSLPGEGAVTYRGVVTRNEVLGESVWRGSPASGRDLVVFLREAECSDTMSTTKHPVTARVSMPDLRFLAGCCRIAQGDNPEKTALEGVSWRLTSLPGKDNTALSALQRPVIARFAADQVSGFSGCNNFAGTYTRDGDRVTLGPLAGTMMACPEPAMSIETAFKAAFAGTIRYSVSTEGLVLTSASGTILGFEAEPPPRLGGATWEVTGFNNNRQAVVSPLVGTRLTLSFVDGAVSGNAGCNTFRATYSTEADRIKVGPPVATRKACAEEVMTQERQFLAALESAVRWRIDGNILDMHRAGDERAIMAVKKK